MRALKPLSPDGIDAAREKAVRYRLLNEPWEAESICRDILAIQPEDPEALVTLLLALTDQFGREGGASVQEARDVLNRLDDEYERRYYAGLICERQAKAHLARGHQGAGRVAHSWFEQALDWYEQAEEVRPEGNDDVVLRWNACLRIMERYDHIHPDEAERLPQFLE